MDQSTGGMLLLLVGTLLGAGAFIAGYEYSRWCDRRGD